MSFAIFALGVRAKALAIAMRSLWPHEITDAQALAAFHELSRTEGILAALESSHAVALAMRLAGDSSKDKKILVNLSGRGDKDVQMIQQALEGK